MKVKPGEVAFLLILCSLNRVIYTSSDCLVSTQGTCQCIKQHIDDANGKTEGLRLECSSTTSDKLSHDIDLLSKRTSNLILILQVRDSNLRNLANLPSGLYNVHELILDNTGIDLETVRESNELLKNLKNFRVYNENFTEIPEDFFRGMDELKVLSLNYIGIAYISKDAFSNLEDSLIELELRENKLRSFPIAIQSLSHLESLDLYGNEIKTVPDDLTSYLQSNLKRLKRLTMNYINCSCDVGQSNFATWIRSHAIKGVTCQEPNKLFGKDVSITPIEEFCDSAATHLLYSNLIIFCLILSMTFLI